MVGRVSDKQWKKIVNNKPETVYIGGTEKDYKKTPREYELLKIKYEDDSEQVVWWDGHAWGGLRPIKEDVDIVGWKYEGNRLY